MFYNFFSIIYHGIFSNVNEIIPGVWLGNYLSVEDSDFLVKNDISVVINCTPNLPTPKIQTNFFRISVNDSLLEQDIVLMKYYLAIVLPYLKGKYSDNKNILIHCYAGKQRSAIVMVCLIKILMESNNEGIKRRLLSGSEIQNIEIQELIKKCDKKSQFYKIINYIRSKRPQAFSYGFKINFKKSYYRYFNV